jgi:membrane protein required for colicin V production
MEGFNYLDIIVLFLIVLLGLKGYINGLLKEIFTLVGIVGGIFIASRYSYEIGELIHQNIFELDNDGKKNFAGFILGIVGFWLGLNVVRYIIEAIASDTAFSTVNKLLGIIVSSVKIFAILAVITHSVSNFEVVQKNIKELTDESFMYPILKKSGAYIIKIDIEDFKKKSTVESAIDDVADELKGISGSTTNLSDKIDELKDSATDVANKVKDSIK